MSTPAVDRTIRILELLATHPGEAFTLSELSRRTHISKATLHSILASLSVNGYLVRDPLSQRYGLGPALIPLGDVAERGHPAIGLAREEAERLSKLLDVQVLVTWATESDQLILIRSGIARASSFSARPGQRLPLRPPMGTPFLAWADDEKVEAWLEQLGPNRTEQQVAFYRRALAAARERGYAVGFGTSAYARLSEIYDGPEEVRTREAQSELDDILAELADQRYLETDGEEPSKVPLRVVAVPIFDHHGQLALSMSLLLDDRFTAADLPVVSDHALRAAATVMAAINGRHPDVTFLAH